MAQLYPLASKKIFFKQKFLFILFLLAGISSYSQNCTVNAGVLNITICETDALVLEGNNPTPITGTVEWTQISGPAVVINSPNSPTSTISGYTGGNTYIFRYSATCGDGVLAYQDKVVNVLPITIADAGTSIASCPDSSGSLVINANAPVNPGETGRWEIIGNNSAGVVINFPSSATSTITLPATSCGTTTLEWIIEGTEYAPGLRCRTTSQITVTNYGGVTPVSAGSDQNLSNCYTTTQSANLNGSYGGCGLNGQNGQWTFVSGPNTPTISSPGSNSTGVSNLIEGTYVFRWTVTGPCVSGNDQVVITVPAATQDVTNLPGGTENIFFCDNAINQVTLEAQTPLYAGETVQWTQVGGGPGAVIVSPTNPTTLVTNISDSGDPYTFRYTLTNSNTGCVFTKDYVVRYNGATRTILANNGDNLFGSCNQTTFSIPITTTGTGSNSYRILDGPDASPLGPFPTAYSSVGSNLSLTLSAAGVYILEFVRAEGGNLPAGCDYGFDSIAVVVSNDPTPSNAGSDQNLACGVTSTTLAGVVTAIEGTSYWSQLSGPNTAIIGNSFDFDTDISGLIPGSYVMQYITKGGGATCGFSIDTVTINVSDSVLSAVDAGSDATVCGFSEHYLSGSLPEPGEYGEWSQVSGPTPVFFSNINDPNARATGFTAYNETYVLRWTIAYINPGPSCSAPVFDDIEISTNGIPGPTVALAGPDACYPLGTTAIPLEGNQPDITEEGTWTVTPSAGVTFDDEHYRFATATVPGNGTYTFTWTISPLILSCSPTVDSVNITVADTAISANAGPDQSDCNTTFVMAATSSAGTTGTWSRISGLGGVTVSDINDPNATFTFQTSGFYIFRWTAEADVCGIAFDDINITVGIPPNPANAGPDQNICNGTSVVMAANDYDDFFETGEWSVVSGSPNAPVITEPTNPNTSINGLVAGTYTFRWTISAKSVFLCSEVFDDVVVEVAPPAGAGPDQNYCDVSSIQLIGNINSTGTWTLTTTSGNPSDVVITQSPPNSYIANATVVPGNTYMFTYTTDDYTFADSSICPGSSDAVNIEIFDGPSIAPDAGPDQTLCISDVGGITTLNGNTAPLDVDNAQWRFVFQPPGSVAVIDDPANEDTTVSNLTVPGLYILEWVFESTSCRTLSDIVRINMFAAPSTANAGPDDTVACQQTYQTNAVPPTVGIGTWSFANPGDDPSGGDVVINNPNSPVTTLSNITTLGTYVLTWTVTNGPFTSPSLCDPSVDTVVITFNDDPPSVANAGPDQDLCNATQATMAAVPLTSGLGTWTQNSGPSTATIASPNNPASVMFGLVPGTYEFVWTATTVNNDGCSSQDTIEVTIYAPPSASEAGPNQVLPQFTPVVMAATTPTVGTGTWSQITGPSMVSFININSPTTAITGTVSGTYVLQWNVTNGNCAASTDQVTIEIIALADLELNKSVAPVSVNAGDVVTFSIEVFNNDALGGSVDATGVAVRDYIPVGYSVVPGSASNSGQYNIGDNTMTWYNLTIPNGNTITLTFDATVNPIGPYLNNSEIIASDQSDPDSTPDNGLPGEDDQDDATILLNTVDLSLQKSVTPGVVSIGDNVVFTIAVTNGGPNNATGVTVLDQLPAGYTYVSDNSAGAYNAATGIWTIGNIAIAATATIEITAQVNVAVAADYINVAEVQTADEFDTDSTPGNGLAEDDIDNAAITLEQADLELTKSALPASAAAGDQVTFTLTLVNNGPGDATGVDVQDYLPLGLTLVPGSVSNGGSYNIATAILQWTDLVLANGATINLTFDVIVNNLGGYLNTAQITASDLTDPDSTPNNDDGDQSEDDEDNELITFINPSADLSLTKFVVAGNTTPVVGTQVSFELVITNDGPDSATGVEVIDLLPSGYEFVNFSSSAGLYDENTGLWHVGTVDSGVSESLILDAIVLPTGDYLNIAEVTASDLPDPDSTPNNDDGDQSEDDEDNALVTPVFPSADLSLTKIVNNPTPLVGSQVTFEVVVTNSGPQNATGVEVTDLLPSGYTFNSFTATTGAYNTLTGVWTIGSLIIGGSETLQLTATVNATGTFTNVAEVTASSLPDPDSTPDNAVVTEDDYATATTVPVAQSADLTMTKTVNNPTPLVGEQVTFEVVVTNRGPQEATGVEVTDLLPTGYTFVSASATSGAYNAATGLWIVGSVATLSFETLQIIATVNATGDYLNITEVTASDQPDPDSTPANAVATEDDYATAITVPVAQSADLSLTKTVNNPTPLVGSQVTFQVIVTNSGPQDTTGVEVTDLLPSGYTFSNFTVSTGTYDNTTGVWVVGNLANGESETLQIIATVNAFGVYENIAEVTASGLPDPDSAPDNAIATEDDYDSVIPVPVTQSADLSLTKTANNLTPLVGSLITFTIAITNDGPQGTTSVTATDILPTGYTFVSSNATQGTYNAATGLWIVGGMASGTSETLQIIASVNAAGDYENIAEVTSSDTPDPDSTPNNVVDTEDDYDSVTPVPVAQSADLSLTKTVNNPTPLIGSQVTFEVAVTNNGPQDVTGVEVTDLLPTGYTFVSATATQGSYNSTTGLWTVGAITTGSFETLQITATVNAAGIYLNETEVTASSLPDPDSTPNNTDIAEDDYASVATIPVAQAADLSVTKTVNNPTPLVGSQVVFDITVSNDGPQGTTGVTATDILPSGYTFVSYNATQGTYDAATGLWSLGIVDVGASETLQITATVNVAGIYTNTAEIASSDLPDPDSTPANGVILEDDYGSAITVPVAPVADLSINKTIVGNTLSPLVGSQITFSINIKNAGPQDATGIQLTDLLPSGYDFDVYSASAGTYDETTGIWDIGTLALNGTETLLVTVTVNPTGGYLNSAEITASDLADPDSTPANGITTEDDYSSIGITPIAAVADLSLTKTVNNPVPLVGSQVTFEVMVTNGGPQDTAGVTVTDLLPTGYTFVSSTATQGSYNSATGLWTVGIVTTGSFETLQITATVNTAGIYLNETEVTASSLPDPDSTPNNTDTTEDDYASVSTAPVQQSADLSLTKTVNTPTPLVGSQVIFEVVVINDGPQDATDVEVTDLLPSGYTFSNFTVSTGTYDSTTGVWSLGNLANGESETLQLTATVNATGTYTNVAEVTASNLPDPDSTPGNAVATEDDYATATPVPVALSADLSLTKTVNNATPLVGSQVTFEVVVTNSGPQDVTGVEVTDLLPTGYTYNSFTVSTGTYNNTTGIWVVGNMVAGESETLQITATVNTTGIYANVAEVSASSLPDPDSTPDNAVVTEDDYATATTVPVAQSADLTMTKTVNNPTPLVGEQVTFEVVVTNRGPQEATGVEVTDLLPTGYTFVSASATSGAYNAATGLWIVGSVATLSFETLQIIATVNATGDYLNITEVTASDQPDPDSTPANAVATEDDYATAITVPVAQSADLSLTKTVNNPTPLVGSEITFEIVITNDGPQDVTGVEVTDLLPTGYTYNSFNATAGTYAPVTGLWSIGNLTNGQSVTLQVTATVNATGIYTNVAEVSASSLPDPNSTPGNAIATEDDYDSVTPVPVAQSADLSLTKIVNNATPLVGSQVTFEVVVTNSGSQDVTGVEVTDVLPNGYTYNSFNATAGTYNATTGLWIVGSLTTLSFETLQITATVNATGAYTNIAEVSASDLPDPDSIPGNAVATEDDYDSVTPVPVAQSADLSLTKTVNNPTPLVGSQVTFEVVVTNDGPQNVTGVEVTDLLPTGCTYDSFNATAGTYNATTGLWVIGSLTNGQSVTLQVTATVNATGDYTNIAEVTASGLPDPDSTPGNTIATEDDYASVTTVPVIQVADLSLTKIVNSLAPLVGSQVIFDITVTNDGPQATTGVTVTDLLLSGYTFVSYNATLGNYNATTGLWTIGVMVSGASETLQVVATVNATGIYQNSAEVTTSDLPDPDSTPGNAVATEDDYDSVTPVPVAQSADLSLTKTVNNPTPLVGSQVTFEVVVTNNGPQDVTGVEVTDLLPTGYTYDSFNATTGTYSNTTGLWAIGNLTNGQSVTLQVTATVNATGDYTNVAEVLASNLPDPDSTPGNAVATEDDYDSVTPVPVAQSADLSLTKTVNNPTPLVGSQVTFEVIVTNSGPQDVTGVEVTELLPSGYTFSNFTVSAGTYAPVTGLWIIGNLTNGQSVTLQVIATVNATGDYTNIAEVSASDLPDPDSTPGNAIATEDDYDSVTPVPVAQSADLSLTKTVNNPTPLVGSQVTFEVIVTNSGPQDVTGVEVTELLPSGYTFSNFTVSTGTYDNATGVWVVGNLANSESVTLQIIATVNATGTYTNVAEVTASDLPDPDSIPGNAVATEDDYDSVTPVPVAQSADLSLTKTVNNPTPLVGSQVTFEVIVTNGGPQDVTGVEVTDLLPTGYTYSSFNATAGTYSNTTGLWAIGDLTNGQSVTLQITATVNATGDYTNVAEVSASDLPDPDSIPDNAVTTEDDYAGVTTVPVIVVADLSLTKTVNNLAPLVGSQVIFDITVSNGGPQGTTNVTATDLLPSGYTFVSYNATQGGYNATSGLWTIGVMASGASETLQVVATVNATGIYQNSAEVTTSDLPDPDSAPGNAVATEDDYDTVIPVPVAQSADLSLTKTVNNPTPLVGSQVIFEIAVTNGGSQDATGIQVIDALPSGYTFVSYNATQGTYNTNTGVWNLGDMTNGELESLQLTAIVNATGDYLNAAEILSSNLPDPDSTPNNADTTEDDYDSIATVPVAQSADLSLTKTVNNPTPLVGSQVTFSIQVSNGGPQDATGVTVTDLLPTGYTYNSYNATAGAYDSTTGLWTVGNLANGTFHTLQITATVDGSGNYENIAEVTASSLPDPDSAPNNAISSEDDYASVGTVPIPISADLSITKTVNNPTPLVGSGVVFTIMVTNNGPQTATGVQVADLLPSGYSFNVATTTSGTYNNLTGIWEVGTVANGVSETLLISVDVLASGDYLNIAEITISDIPDPDSTPGNGITTEDDYASIGTSPIAVTADLSLTKTVNNPTPLVGNGVTFEIIVTNSGPQDATGVIVTDLLPSGYSYVIASSTEGVYNNVTGQWIVGTLPAGASESLLINSTVLPTGDYFNVAEVTSSNEQDPDSTPGNGITTEDDYASIGTSPIAVTADLSLTKTVNNPTPLVGNGVTFEIIVTNSGPQDATGVIVTDLLPSGYSYVIASSTEGVYNNVTGQWIVGTLPAGASESLLINSTVLPTGDYFNVAEVTSSNEQDPDSTPDNSIVTEDDYASATTVPVTPQADLSLIKTIVGGNATPVVGSQIIFNIEVSNAGPADATGIQIIDALPSGYTFVSYNATEGIYNNLTGIWNIGDPLVSGASTSLQITAIVNATGDYTNITEITASDLQDPDSTPNNGITTEDDYDSVTSVPIAQSADLSLTKTVNNPTPLVGSQIIFDVTVSNDGPQVTTGVTITDLLPSGYTFVSYNATQGSYNVTTGLWTVGTMASGSSETLQVTATVNATGIYTNVAEVTASSLPDPDSIPGNAIATEDDYDSVTPVSVAQSADLSLTKTVNNPTPLVGSQVTFEVVVANGGPQDVTGVEVTDVLPTGYTYNSFNATAGTYNNITGLWVIGGLTNGQSVTLQVTATVNATGIYTNVAEVTASDLPDPNSTPGNAIASEDDYDSVTPIPVAQSADLSLTKTVNNPTPLVGSQVTFEVVVTNGGPQDVTGVEVTDALPNGYTYNSFNATAGTYNNTTGLWVIGGLTNGQSVTLQVTATVNVTGIYTNVAEVTASDLPDPNSTPGNAIATEDDYDSVTPVPVAQSADLSLTKTVNNPTPLVGSQVTFEVVVTNSGPQNVTGVEVTDVLPTGYTYNSFTVSSGTYSNTTGIWVIGNMLTGESETLQVTATVNTTGVYSNVAEVTASGLPDPDSTPGNAIATEDDYATAITVPIAQSADLSLTKTVNNPTPLVGSQVTFEVVVTNGGPQDVTGVEVTDVLPNGYTYNSFNATAGTYNNTTGLWAIGGLTNGQSVTLQVTATVNITGIYTNVAEVTASGLPDPDSTPGNAIATEDDYDSVTPVPVVQSADLSLTKTVNNPTPLVGSQVTFEVVVTNGGPQDVTGVKVTDLLPTGYTYNSFNATAGTYNNTTGLWAIGGLTNGQSVTLQITATVNATGDYTNVAEVSASDLPDPDSTPGNAVATEDDYDSIATVPVTQVADLSLTKTIVGGNATPLVGSQISFELIVSNAGPQNVSGVQVTDLLPTGYTYTIHNASAGNYNTTTGLWNIGSLLNGDSETLIVTATVNAAGNHINIAEITASSLPDPDSTPDNAVATEDDYDSVVILPIPPIADLSLSKTVVGGNLSPVFGATITFQVTVTNNGPQDATGVKVIDLLPSGYEYVVFSSTAGTYNEATGLWNIGTIANGSSETLLMTVTVNSTGNYLNIAEVFEVNLPDPNSTPNNGVGSEDDLDSVEITPVPQQADLSITKQVEDNELTPNVGDEISFVITVTNSGPNIATGVVVKDILPSGYDFVFYNATSGSYDNTTGLWNPGIILPGGSQTLLMHVLVNTPSGAPDEYLNETEVVACTQLDPDSTPDNGVTTEDDYDSIFVTPVIVQADLSIEKNTVTGNLVHDVGATVVFEITVTNDGPGDASGVAVSDLLPSGFTYVTHTATSGTYSFASGIWDVGIVFSGNTQTLLVYATVNAPTGAVGEYSNIAEIIDSNLPDPDSTPNNGVITEDDYDSIEIQVRSADLSLEKTVSNENANVGEIVTFTLQIGNEGPTEATGVDIEDIIPMGYESITAISNAGIFNGSVIRWADLVIPVGGITITYQVTVASPLGLESFDYINTVQIMASDNHDPDSTPGNDNGDQSEDDEDSAFIAIPSTDIAITKEVDNASPTMNATINFTVTANNLGNIAATNLEVTDILPSGYTLVSATVTSGNYDPSSGVWTIPSILPGTAQTLTMQVTVKDINDYQNTASLSILDQIDTDPTNNEAWATASPTCLKIYNEFSPNDDGENDTFHIDCISLYPNNVFEVYNRWGDMVYSRKGYDNSWDGKSDGVEKTLPVGTYFYILDLGDGSERTSGWLYLKR